MVLFLSHDTKSRQPVCVRCYHPRSAKAVCCGALRLRAVLASSAEEQITAVTFACYTSFVCENRNSGRNLPKASDHSSAHYTVPLTCTRGTVLSWLCSLEANQSLTCVTDGCVVARRLASA